MENAAEALKLAFAVFVFVMALSVCISNFSLARETADIVLTRADETSYYEYEDTGNTEYRIVGLETIIPTMYKYNKENYTIKFRTGSYDEQLGNVIISDVIELYKSPRNAEAISELDLTEERKRNEPWTGSNDEVKKYLDAIIYGVSYDFPDGTTGSLNYNYSSGLINKFKNYKFLELIGRVQNTDSSNKNKTTSKTVITYVKIQ